MLGFLGGLGGLLGKMLPVATKVFSALPAIGGIAQGIGRIFGGKHEERANKVSNFLNTASDYGNRVTNVVRDAAPGMIETGNMMANQIGGMFNAARNTYSGARSAFNSGDYAGTANQVNNGINQISNGIGNLFNLGRQAYYSGVNAYNRGRRSRAG